MPAAEPNENGVEVDCAGWPKGDAGAAELRPKPPFSFGSSGLPFISMLAFLAGLSSIMISEFSCLGGVTLREAAGVEVAAAPKSTEPDVPAGVDGAPNAKALACGAGVDGAGVPNVNGDFGGSGADDADDAAGWPKLKPDAPPKSGLGAWTVGAGSEAAGAGAGAVGCPKVNGDFGGSAALGLGVADAPPKGFAVEVDDDPNWKGGFNESPVDGLLSVVVVVVVVVVSAGFAGAPNEKGSDEGAVEGASAGFEGGKLKPEGDAVSFSAGLGAPKLNPEVGVLSFSAGLGAPKLNADVGVLSFSAGFGPPKLKAETGAGGAAFSSGLPNEKGAAVDGASAAFGAETGSGDVEGAVAGVFGKREPDGVLPNAGNNGAGAALLASACACPSLASAPNRDCAGAAALPAPLPKRDGVSLLGADDGAAGGIPKENADGRLTWAVGLANAAELAKKLGTAEEPLPVKLAFSCSDAGCCGAVASTLDPGLGGMRAICGTAFSSGVRGAGAQTVWDSEATVMGSGGSRSFPCSG